MVEIYVLNRIKELLVNDKVLKDIVDNINKDKTSRLAPLKSQEKHLNELLNDLEQRKEKVFELFEDGIIDKDKLKERLEKLHENIEFKKMQLEQIKDELKQIPVESISYEMVKAVFYNFNNMLEKAEPEDQKLLLHMLIDKITVTDRRNVDTIEIHYNGQLKALLELT